MWHLLSRGGGDFSTIDSQQMLLALQRAELTQQSAPFIRLEQHVASGHYIRILSLEKFWDSTQTFLPQLYLQDVFSGLHGLNQSVSFLILSRDGKLEIYLGVHSAGDEIHALLRNSLIGALPGIEIEYPVNGQVLGNRILNSNAGKYARLICGIPTGYKDKPLDTRQSENEQLGNGLIRQIERLLRATRFGNWAYFVSARPIPSPFLVNIQSLFLQMLREYSRRANLPQLATGSITYTASAGIDHTVVKLLERQAERLQEGAGSGLWLTTTYTTASTEPLVQQVSQITAATLNGPNSYPENIRVLNTVNDSSPYSPDHFATTLSTRELTNYIQLPLEEQPGFAIRHHATFDLVQKPIVSPGGMVLLGEIVDGGMPTGAYYTLPVDDMSKHGMVAGVTGSGKTNTCFTILDHLWKQGKGKPFLVIEPAKTEYRDLLYARDSITQQPLFPKLMIFTFGDERCVPFRMNPFEFEVLDVDNRISVQTHIDLLRSLFNASFVLYAPMPYVLDRCLHEIYEDKGWDLSTSINYRIGKGHPAIPAIFPTLSDLYLKIEEVVERLGYEERIKMDVQAGLQARINSLRLGTKGMMLDTRHSYPTNFLLENPTILELEAIGDDEEKAFLMGLVLLRLYEFRIVHAKKLRHEGKSANQRFSHLTLIEEAHRLLQNVSQEFSTEQANVKGKAVETFSNMLSEIRAYGEGILVAEQIPTKLAPDIIKNSNLKILHRLVSKDDRETLGATMNMDETQQKYITALKVGQGVVYTEGDDKPLLLNIMQHTGVLSRGVVSDLQVRKYMSPFLKNLLHSDYPDSTAQCNGCKSNSGQCVSGIKSQINTTLEKSEFNKALNRCFVRMLEEPNTLNTATDRLIDEIRRSINNSYFDESHLIDCLLIHGSARIIEIKERHYRWPVKVSTEILTNFSLVILWLLHNKPNNNLPIPEINMVKQLQAIYRQFAGKSHGPYIGCKICPTACLYRYEVKAYLSEVNLQIKFTDAINNFPTFDQRINAMADVSLAAARQVGAVNHETAKKIAFCYLTQRIAARGYEFAIQSNISEKVLKTLI